MVTYAKISLKMLNPRDIAGNIEEEEAVKWKQITKESRKGYRGNGFGRGA